MFKHRALPWRWRAKPKPPVVIDLDISWVIRFEVALSERLQEEDLWFQLQMEVAMQPNGRNIPVAFDFEPMLPQDASRASTGGDMSRDVWYRVYGVPLALVHRLQRTADAFDLTLTRLGVCSHDAEGVNVTRAINFLPHRQQRWQQCKNTWWRYSGLALLSGVLAACTAQAAIRWGFTQNAASQTERSAAAQALSVEQTKHAQAAQSLQQGLQEKQQADDHLTWLQRNAQWQRVLQSTKAQVWLSQLVQDGVAWRAVGQGLTQGDALRLQTELLGLRVWEKPPTLTRVVLVPASESARLPVWQFELVATLLGPGNTPKPASP